MSHLPRHIPQSERSPKLDSEVGKCAKMAAIAEVDRLTREVHTACHLLSAITKRLFDLKEQIERKFDN